MDRPVKVLFVLGSLNRGGAETWVTQLIKKLDRKKVAVDILVHKLEGPYTEVLKSYGVRIFQISEPQHYFSYTKQLKALLLENGPYDIIHSHLQLYSGIILKAACEAGVKIRIAHARNSSDGRQNSLFTSAYRWLMRTWIKRYASYLFAVSTEAAEGAFWKGVIQEGRCQLLTGVDFEPFLQDTDREEIRRWLGIPRETLVLGHIGSFRKQKNQAFLVEIACELVKEKPDCIFLLVGEGELRASIEQMVAQKGLGGNFCFLGEYGDIPRVLQAVDIFLFPSLYEGLPRVIMEAQAAGLPCICSDLVTTEAAAWPGNVAYLPLNTGSRAWVEKIFDVVREPRLDGKRFLVVKAFDERGQTIDANAAYLTDFYGKVAAGE